MSTNGPPNWWYEPKTGHELDPCEDCHTLGEHEDTQEWAEDGCWMCYDECGEDINNVDN